jgi:hypothetical protein
MTGEKLEKRRATLEKCRIRERKRRVVESWLVGKGEEEEEAEAEE